MYDSELVRVVMESYTTFPFKIAANRNSARLITWRVHFVNDHYLVKDTVCRTQWHLAVRWKIATNQIQPLHTCDLDPRNHVIFEGFDA